MSDPRAAAGLPERVEAVLLDAGGVLVDLDYGYVRRLLEAQGFDPTPDELSRAEAHARSKINESVGSGGSVGDAWRDYFHIIFGQVRVPGNRHEALIDSLWEAHERVGLWTVACDGSLDAVAELKRLGFRLGVVSNAEGTVARNLDDAGFAAAFETVVDSHLVGVEKPDPAIFGIALERMSLRPECTVFVGDLPHVDVIGARAAGIAPILLDRHDLHPDCDATRIRSLAELPPLLSA